MRVYHSRAQLKCEVIDTASARVAQKGVTDVGEPLLRRGRSDPRAGTAPVLFYHIAPKLRYWSCAHERAEQGVEDENRSW